MLTPVDIFDTIRSNLNRCKEQAIAKITRLNQMIRASQLRVIDQDGKQLGVLSRDEALQLAQEQELDLVEISPEASPPVAKIIDWCRRTNAAPNHLRLSR